MSYVALLRTLRLCISFTSILLYGPETQAIMRYATLWLILMNCIVACVRVSAQAGAVKPAAVPMATYSDPAGDVSFDYPVVWKIDNAAKFYIPLLILQRDRKPQVQVVFSPAGNLYQKTTLLGLAFAYVKTPQPSQEACAAIAVSPASKAETVTINGASFQHFENEEAGMCHGAKQEIYRTYRNGNCYLFEGDMDTSCSGVRDGQRDLTPAETKALMRHLNAIPQSIRFAAQ
jgi:hypothetical protein